MRLFAAISPPTSALEELSRVVRSVTPDGGRPAKSQSRKGLLGRFGGGGTAVAEPVDHGQLTMATLEDMYIPITGFGNVTLGDSGRLAAALREQAAGWEQPRLRFAGGTALEFRGDESVWAKLDGDVDALSVIGRGVPQVVQRLGFFVDRRQFRPWLAVGRITPETTAPYLEALVAALEAFEGEPWTVEGISLMRGVPESEKKAGYEEMERMPLQP